MLCYIVNKLDFDKRDKGYCNNIYNFVCIGGITNLNQAYLIANTLPCLTEVRIIENKVKACYIICNP